MNVQKRNDVSIYCLSEGNALPEWLGDRARRNLSKTNESVRRRIELLQDFAMPASSSRLVQSSDGRYIMAAGTYPPRIRCYDVHELALKFERYLTASAVDMVLLGSDYGKVALLLDDRTIAFHAHYGAHESIRIPSFGRAMAYEPSTCELLIAAKGDSVYRVNLDEGRFSEPWELQLSNNDNSSVSATCISVHPRHALATVGCDDGTVRFWDGRSADTLRRPFLKLDVSRAVTGYGYADATNTASNEITATAHDQSGLYMAFGTRGGLVALYDVRSSRPLHVQEHKHGLPIHTVRFHASSNMILSSDEKLIKVWRYKSSADMHFSTQTPSATDAQSSHPLEPNQAQEKSAVGAVKVNIEGSGKFTHFIVAGDESDPGGDRSGLILCATDQPKMDSFYVPAIGVAPKWCSYLESITEELEERDLKRDGANGDDLVQSGQETVFENYKFVTRENLEQLGISNLVGTPLLRGYMHGFFMDVNLYNRVKAVANPFEYEEYQKRKLQERLKAKQSSRIAPRADDLVKKTKTAVNSELAERLENKATASTKTGRVAQSLLSDDRFGNLFTNPDFEIDEEDEDFKLRNPSGVSAKNKKNNLDSESESDEEVEQDNDSDVEGSDSINGTDDENDNVLSDGDTGHALDGMDSDSDEDGFRGAKVRGEAYQSMKNLKTTKPQGKPKRAKGAKPITMYEAQDEGIGAMAGTAIGLGTGVGNKSAVSAQAQRRQEEMSLPLSKRKALEHAESSAQPQVRTVASTGGSREAVYIPRGSKQRKLEGGDPIRGATVKHIRRGVKELGFKAPFIRHKK
jgi:ribosome biogenesis protein ENP2